MVAIHTCTVVLSWECCSNYMWLICIADIGKELNTPNYQPLHCVCIACIISHHSPCVHMNALHLFKSFERSPAIGGMVSLQFHLSYLNCSLHSL